MLPILMSTSIRASMAFCLSLAMFSIQLSAANTQIIKPGDLIILVPKKISASLPSYKNFILAEPTSTLSGPLSEAVIKKYNRHYSFLKFSNEYELNFICKDAGDFSFNRTQTLNMTLTNTDSSLENFPNFSWTMTHIDDFVSKRPGRHKTWFTDPTWWSCSLSRGWLPLVKPTWNELAKKIQTERKQYVWLLFTRPTEFETNPSTVIKEKEINSIDSEEWPYGQEVPFNKLVLVDVDTLVENPFDAEAIIRTANAESGCCGPTCCITQ
jgi:hypothetical protein